MVATKAVAFVKSAKLREFNRPALSAIRNDLVEALAGIALRHGFEIEAGKIRFTKEAFSVQVSARIEGAKSEEARRYEDLAEVVGLNPAWLDKEVNFAGKRFVVRGLVRGSKSVLIEGATDKKRYKAKVERFIAAARLA